MLIVLEHHTETREAQGALREDDCLNLELYCPMETKTNRHKLIYRYTVAEDYGDWIRAKLRYVQNFADRFGVKVYGRDRSMSVAINQMA